MWVPVVQLADGMILGGATWLGAIAENAHLSYGLAHGKLGLFRQAFYQWGAGDVTAWEGETIFQTEHPTLEFSAWIIITGEPIYASWAMLQLYYGGEWHDFAGDGNVGEHWFDEAGAVNGVISRDISAYYDDGEVVRVRLRISEASAWIYRAALTGTSGLDPWPTIPTFAGSPTVHDADDFNTLRTAATLLEAYHDKPAIPSFVATAYHGQSGGGQELLTYSFHLDGRQNLHIEATVTDATEDNYIEVYLQDEQFPHGVGGGVRTLVATWNSDGNKSEDIDLTGLTKGTYYGLSFHRVVNEVWDPYPRLALNRLYVCDHAGVTRSNVSGTFEHKDVPTPEQLNTLGGDLEEMRPDAGSESPVWPEHLLVSHTTDGLGLLEITGRRWQLVHLHDFLLWRGAGRIVSTDGQFSQNLAYTEADQVAIEGGSNERELQVLDLRTLGWLAVGDIYYVEDVSTSIIAAAYESAEAPA